MTLRQEKMNRELQRVVSQFFAETSNRTSLITVTSVDIAPDFKRATIGITVLPQTMEEQAIGFALRRNRDLRDFIKKHLKTGVVPRIDVVIDDGEKNRQKIESIMAELAGGQEEDEE